MNKYQQFKKALQNPPPERLAKIEYQSHLLQAFGITTVSIILIFKGLWYIIFAFIFAIGINYSQGMSAYNKYNNIMAIITPEKVKDYDKDISPTRRRRKIITHVFGSAAWWSSILLSVAIPLFFVTSIESRWLMSLAYVLMIGLIFVGTYFFLFYWIAYPMYKKELKKK